MAEYVGFSIDFDAPFGTESLRVLFTTIREAIDENWGTHRDELSWPRPGEFDVESLMAETLRQGSGEGRWNTDWIGFTFGPLSMYSGLLTVGRGENGKLFACVSVCDTEMYRDDRDRLRHRVEFEPGFRDPRFPPEPRLGAGDALADDLDRLDAHREACERIDQGCYRDREAVWAASASCLRHIADRLAVAMAAESVRMDEEIGTNTP